MHGMCTKKQAQEDDDSDIFVHYYQYNNPVNSSTHVLSLFTTHLIKTDFQNHLGTN